MSDPHETPPDDQAIGDQPDAAASERPPEDEPVTPSTDLALEALLAGEVEDESDEEGPAEAPDSEDHPALDNDDVAPASHEAEATAEATDADHPLPDDGEVGDEGDAEEDVVELWNDSDQGTADVARAHAKGLLEALVFVSETPVKAFDLAKTAGTSVKGTRELLAELQTEYGQRGVRLEEVAGGWVFRTSAAYAPYVRELTKQKPVKLTRAQVETLAILAYRQPITRPEIDDIRGVDCGAVLKVLLERDLIKILGKKDEPGRPILYGTTSDFLSLFGLGSLKDLPTLREFTELSDDSKRVVEQELGDALEASEADDESAVAAAPIDPSEFEDPPLEEGAPSPNEPHEQPAPSPGEVAEHLASDDGDQVPDANAQMHDANETSADESQ